ncbi:hypothetical protein [Quadrisphaera setariae]|uniref:Uncharacterized protein n=1 Tax=Quadrisphaera setariae TaxID=2593304 RepID=A0A5C8Z5Y1_9ACTN|nr:hypothetical protein [Quadrisphaera setariae]TXR52541.1 hypothetical protein FMM08_19005 [Quadrisphaera setariae]
MPSSASAAAPPPPLERSYRRLLRVLPRGYRERWEDDVVAVLLDTEQEAAARAVVSEGPQRQDEERELVLLQRPRLREVVGVLGLAVRLHLAAPSTPGASARSRAVGDAARLTALLGLLPAAYGVVDLALLPWQSRQPGWSQLTPADGVEWVAGCLAALLTWTLLVAGHRRTAVGVAVAGMVVPWLISGAQLSPWALQPRELVVWLVLLVPLLSVAAWHRDAPAPSPRWWWALPAAVAVVFGLWGLETAHATGASFAADPLVAGAALAAGWRRPHSGWLGAAGLLGLVALVWGVVTLGYLAGTPLGEGMAAATVLAAVTTAASGLVVLLAVVRLRVLARAGRLVEHAEVGPEAC